MAGAHTKQPRLPPRRSEPVADHRRDQRDDHGDRRRDVDEGLTIGGMKLGPLVFGVGLLGVLYMMLSWWMDVIREAEHEGHHTRVVQIASPLRHDDVHRLRGDVLRRLVLGLFRRQPVHRRGDQLHPPEFTGGVWPPKGIETFDPWHLPLLNTLILLTSGTTVTWAHHALIHGDRKG